MKNILDNLGRVIGSLLGIVIMGGLFFVQCVYPFIEDNSESVTCDDSRMSNFCNDKGTIAGFAVALCDSRESVKFTGNLIKTIELGGGETEPRRSELVIKCPGLNASWETEAGTKIKAIDDMPPSNKQAERFVDAFKAYVKRSITIEVARQRVMETK